ncbi:DUF2357 domain-containing protein [Azotobacter beijerinckii]|uniref:DUF2357 domain-containing protein n=1 Tax=Azotobacter beijerinckii TaxID=170623 RepID=A0A1I4HCW7_9GAMM|nr:DUF2357 domain-containing protein [Azotobacter beijerinckii]SFL39291.1 protein of unknown function [Azotobacter beijerinckii]
MIEIEILNGERRGKVLTLDSAVKNIEPLTLLEDEVLVFRLREKDDLPDLALGLHENLVRYTQRRPDGDGWVYEWQPKDRSNGRKEAFFHNFYGLAELCLTLMPQEGDTRPSFVVALQPVEVLARKINADRVAAMLEFMSRHDAAQLANAIRITRLRAGHRQGGRTVEHVLDRIQHNLEFLRQALPSVAAQPLRRLHQRREVVTPTPNTLIDESSIRWIVENPDHLVAAPDDRAAVIEWEDEPYALVRVLETQSAESTDLYENQVIHGFVAVLIQATREIRARLADSGSARPGQTAAVDGGYVSFFTQIGRFSATINANKILRCEAILAELARLREWLVRAVPVSRKETAKPVFTQKARHTLLYQQVFRKVLIWHSYGEPDWSVQDELTSIKSIDKLFEYYVLCLIRHQLEQTEVRGVPLAMAEDDDQAAIEYRLGDVTIRLFYEPTIWMAGHADAAGQEMVNTEGWTRYEDDDGHARGRRTRYRARASAGVNARRTPDYLIEIARKGQPRRYLVIDAKYTTRFRAFHDKLPELTMKYLHGIHQQGTGVSLASALMIVNPDDRGETWHFHTPDYSIHGPTPATPALLVTSVDVAKAHEAESNIGRDLRRLLELNLGEVHPSLSDRDSGGPVLPLRAVLA